MANLHRICLKLAEELAEFQCVCYKSRMQLTRNEYLLTGPQCAGKSSIAKYLAINTDYPIVNVDNIRWRYFERLSYDKNFAQYLLKNQGFKAIFNYWRKFEAYTLQHVLLDYKNCIFDFGAGYTAQDDPVYLHIVKNSLAPFINSYFILPSLNTDVSINILKSRLTTRYKNDKEGLKENRSFDLSSHIVKHEFAKSVVKYRLYTEDKEPLDVARIILHMN